MAAYFDNAATTALCGAVKAAFEKACEIYANPSSVHSAGLEAEKLISASRKKLLSVTGGTGKGTIVFTGCGTESNALALFGAAYAKKANEKKNIIISDSEHPSVYKAAEELKNRGFEIREVKTRGGAISADELSALVDDGTFLISIMTVNNETGAEYDIKELCRVSKAKNPRVIFHTDATQAFMKTDTDVSVLGVDMMTLSAHKIGGPKGVGALYISDGVIRSRSVVPVLYGGGQEGGLRSGTENTAGIAAFAAAAEYGKTNFGADLSRIKEISEYIKTELEKAGVRVNRPVRAVPHIISASLPGIKSEVMLRYLSAEGIYISSGSACSSHHPGISRSLQAFGLQAKEADCTVRISLWRTNTLYEAELLVENIKTGVKSLIKIRK